MDLTELTSQALIGMGLGGLVAWDGVGQVNVLAGQPWSGQSSMLHGTTRSKRLGGMTTALYHPQTLNPEA